MNNLNSTKGFSLVEVTLALGIAAFTLLAIFGLMPVGMTANQGSSEQTIAAEIASAIATDLLVTPAASGTNVALSPVYQIPISTTPHVFYISESVVSGTNVSSGLAGSSTLSNDARYRVQVTLSPVSSATNTRAGSIVVSWPPRQNDLNRAMGVFRTAVALDRN